MMNNRKLSTGRTQSGIGLPAAIFVITLMVIIAIAVNQLVNQNAQTFQEEINLTRAFYAAESGAGFAMNGIYPPEEYSSYGSRICGAGSPATYSFTVDGLNTCTATVVCDDTIQISGVTYTTIESTGSCGDVERTIQVRTVY